MNIDIWSFWFGVSVGIVLVLVAGLVVILAKKRPVRELNLPTCTRCGSKKLNPIADKPGTYWCGKCGYESNLDNTPAKPPEQPKSVFSCKHCKKEFADETKLQRHMGMAHYKEIAI